MNVARTEEPWHVLLRRTLGAPGDVAHKARRFARAIAAHLRGRDLDDQLRRLHDVGVIDAVPTRVQLATGALDMLRFWIVPASQEYYAQQGIDFRFHQLLRFFDDPASLVDPIGLSSETDVVVGHLLQVVHANPRYDLELLEAREGGLDALEHALVTMLDGTHPRARSIGAIVEEPDYHARLLEYLRLYRRDRDAPAPLRSNVASSPRLREIEKTFGSMRTAFRYFASLPRDLGPAARHLAQVRKFEPRERAQP
jgi:hypothetical protein